MTDAAKLWRIGADDPAAIFTGSGAKAADCCGPETAMFLVMAANFYRTPIEAVRQIAALRSPEYELTPLDALELALSIADATLHAVEGRDP